MAAILPRPQCVNFEIHFISYLVVPLCFADCHGDVEGTCRSASPWAFSAEGTYQDTFYHLVYLIIENDKYYIISVTLCHEPPVRSVVTHVS